MIKVLTETEYKFLKEFIALIEKYNLLFTTDEKGEIEVTVHRQQLATETNQNSDLPKIRKQSQWQSQLQ